MAAHKEKARRIACVENLNQLGLAMRIWSPAQEVQYQFATPTSTNSDGSVAQPGKNELASYLRFRFTNEVSPALLACPSDTRLPATSMASLTDQNISYFFNPDANETLPQSVILGDRNLATNGVPLNRGRNVISTNSSLQWTAAIHHGAGNVAMGDGSVQQFTSGRIRDFTGRLLLP